MGPAFNVPLTLGHYPIRIMGSRPSFNVRLLAVLLCGILLAESLPRSGESAPIPRISSSPLCSQQALQARLLSAPGIAQYDVAASPNKIRKAVLVTWEYIGTTVGLFTTPGPRKKFKQIPYSFDSSPANPAWSWTAIGAELAERTKTELKSFPPGIYRYPPFREIWKPFVPLAAAVGVFVVGVGIFFAFVAWLNSGASLPMAYNSRYFGSALIIAFAFSFAAGVPAFMDRKHPLTFFRWSQPAGVEPTLMSEALIHDALPLVMGLPAKGATAEFHRLMELYEIRPVSLATIMKEAPGPKRNKAHDALIQAFETSNKEEAQQLPADKIFIIPISRRNNLPRLPWFAAQYVDGERNIFIAEELVPFLELLMGRMLKTDKAIPEQNWWLQYYLIHILEHEGSHRNLAGHDAANRAFPGSEQIGRWITHAAVLSRLTVLIQDDRQDEIARLLSQPVMRKLVEDAVHQFVSDPGFAAKLPVIHKTADGYQLAPFSPADRVAYGDIFLKMTGQPGPSFEHRLDSNIQTPASVELSGSQHVATLKYVATLIRRAGRNGKLQVNDFFLLINNHAAAKALLGRLKNLNLLQIYRGDFISGYKLKLTPKGHEILSQQSVHAAA